MKLIPRHPQAKRHLPHNWKEETIGWSLISILLIIAAALLWLLFRAFKLPRREESPIKTKPPWVLIQEKSMSEKSKSTKTNVRDKRRSNSPQEMFLEIWLNSQNTNVRSGSTKSNTSLLNSISSQKKVWKCSSLAGREAEKSSDVSGDYVYEKTLFAKEIKTFTESENLYITSGIHSMDSATTKRLTRKRRWKNDTAPYPKIRETQNKKVSETQEVGDGTKEISESNVEVIGSSDYMKSNYMLSNESLTTPHENIDELSILPQVGSSRHQNISE